jgi:hypothetical protein
VCVEEILSVTKQSSRSGILFPSVGQFVGVAVDRNEYLCSWITFDNSVAFVVIKRAPYRVCLLLYSLQL